MLSKAELSSVNTNTWDPASQRGLPQKCYCGEAPTIFTSKTQENPGRPFFCCPTKKEDHLFKWVDDAVYEEVIEVLPKIERLRLDVSNAISEMNEQNRVIQAFRDEVVQIKHDIQKHRTFLKFVASFLVASGIVLFGLLIITSPIGNILNYAI